MGKYTWTEWPEKNSRKGYDKMESKREFVAKFQEVFENTGSLDDAEARTGIRFRDYVKWRQEVEDYDKKRSKAPKCQECDTSCQIDLEDI